MKLLFKQKIFSWFDSYDIYDERGCKYFTVKGKASFGHKLNILDASGEHIATLKERLVSFLPRFDIYIGDDIAGTIKKEFKILRPTYNLDCNGWKITGNIFEFDYEIVGPDGHTVAVILKQLLNFTDTYVIDVYNEKDALFALMVVLAIDASKDTRAMRSAN